MKVAERPTAKQKQSCEVLSAQPEVWTAQSDTPTPAAKRSVSAMWLCALVCFEPCMWAICFPTRKPVGGLSNASNTQLIWQISHCKSEKQPADYMRRWGKDSEKWKEIRESMSDRKSWRKFCHSVAYYRVLFCLFLSSVRRCKKHILFKNVIL